MPRRPMTRETLKAKGKLTKNQHCRLQRVIQNERELYNTALQVLEYAQKTRIQLNADDLQKQLTQVRREYPEFKQVHRRLSIATFKRAVLVWNRHAHPDKYKKPLGKPRYKTPERFQTITIESPQSPIIRSTEADHSFLCIKGLPSISLKTHRPIPKDRQPSAASITLKNREISVRLVYQNEPYPKQIPVEKLSNPLGIDLGIIATLATSNGILYTSPNEEKLSRNIKET